MSLFRKPRKALRNRGPVEPEEDDDQDNSIEEIHSNISKLKQKKQEKKKNKDKQKDEKKSLLSFDDELEEETEEFVIKKSKESRRLIKQKERGKKDDFRENKPRKNTPDYENYTSKDVGPINNHDNGHNVKIIDDDIEIVLKVGITISKYSPLNTSHTYCKASVRILTCLCLGHCAKETSRHVGH